MIYGWLILLVIFQLLFFFVCTKKLKILEKRLQGLEWITHKKQNSNEKEVNRS